MLGFFLFLAEELKAHWEKLERERRQNEALTSKLADMEATAVRRETDISELKRLLQLVKEEHQQVMQVPSYKKMSVVVITMRNGHGERNKKTKQADSPFSYWVCVCVCVVGVCWMARIEVGHSTTSTDELIIPYMCGVVAEKEMREIEGGSKQY